jgi:hypothetical protein
MTTQKRFNERVLAEAGQAPEPRDIWYRGVLSVHRSGSPACPDYRVQVDAQVTFRIPAEWPNREDRRKAAKEAAGQAFRTLGLGSAMDLEGARVSIDVVPEW